MSRQIVVWRHGQTDWNLQGRLQGQTDVPLNATGRTQARTAAARLASLRPSRIVTSDLARAASTAAELGRLCGLEPEPDRRLREVAFGDREGLTREEMRTRYPEIEAMFREGREVVVDGAETYDAAAERFTESLVDVAGRTGAGETSVVVAHGGVIRVGLCRFVGLPREHWRTFGGFANCCWAVLSERGPRWQITEWNAGNLPEPVMSDDEASREDDGTEGADPGVGSVGQTR
ncbi:putative phosphoglycerate mutase [Mumia flava]|uniref:Putative phosphoglycerate mutase n=1 Tax=Mumia flava TaxID=1348852 RepID=A0A2M9B7S8_9ACTN|nr:histidine phosphatase family protein [Mumia flava]PJJ53988.1 putative phosphoglycerate mutase [Mumia flava]